MPYDGEEITPGTVEGICERVLELRQANSSSWDERLRIRQIMDGGPEAVKALVGNQVRDPSMRLPVGNLMLTAMTHLAQKLGRPPDVKIPGSAAGSSASLASVKAADKRARIVSAYDDVAGMPLLLPQLGRWIPGYGFAAVVLAQKMVNGAPFPTLELRDPYETFLGEWGVTQQPTEAAFVRVITTKALLRCPTLTDAARRRIMEGNAKGMSPLGYRPDRASWANQTGGGVEIYEYINDKGKWWVCPAYESLLSFTPNLLETAPMHVFRRTTFSKLTGQYDHVVGLMATIARHNILQTIALEDSVNAETVVVGGNAGEPWRRGRGAVNYLPNGAAVRKLNDQLPQQNFQHLAQLERQLRIVAGYPVTDDGQSPTAFATGRGISQLGSSMELEVREYQTTLSLGLSHLDALRLEWDEVHYPNRTKKMEGAYRSADFVEEYTPAKDIKGHRRTRRVYGAMAGWDDGAKIIGGLQLLQAGVIDVNTMRENIDGLENHDFIRERIQDQKVEDLLMDALLARAQQGDPIAIDAALAMLPASDMKAALAKVFAPPEADMTAASLPAAAGMPGGEAPPDVNTILSRLSMANGKVGEMASTQTVGRF